MSRMLLAALTKGIAAGGFLYAVSALATYTDSTTHVHFQYPAVWKKVLTLEFYTPPQLIQSGQQPRVIVEFLPKGNLYQKTNLLGLDFLYATAPASSVDACYGLGDVEIGDAKKDKVTIAGINYQHVSGGGVAMCHEAGFQIYATYRDGLCQLFEEDFMTSCAGVVDGTRGLTPAETKALQGHLDAVMQSVRFATQR